MRRRSLARLGACTPPNFTTWPALGVPPSQAQQTRPARPTWVREDLAVGGLPGSSALLVPVGSDRRQGTWQVTAGARAGSADLAVSGALKNWLQNHAHFQMIRRIAG
jgi:hypothetical protein